MFSCTPCCASSDPTSDTVKVDMRAIQAQDDERRRQEADKAWSTRQEQQMSARAEAAKQEREERKLREAGLLDGGILDVDHYDGALGAAIAEACEACARPTEPVPGSLPSGSQGAADMPSATVRLMSASGKEKLLVFTQRPLKVQYRKCDLPMVVSKVDAGGEGARAGVEVGDTLLACNGLAFEGKDAAACDLLLQSAFASLPLCASVRLRSASGKEKLLAFTHRPLKIRYKCELPVVVTTVEADGEGARLGVEEGDTLLACNGLALEDKDAAACHHLLQEAFSSLPLLS